MESKRPSSPSVCADVQNAELAGTSQEAREMAPYPPADALMAKSAKAVGAVMDEMRRRLAMREDLNERIAQLEIKD